MPRPSRVFHQGLEGRSNNPVSVLFDTLNHPGADFGADGRSTVSWLHRPDQAVDHVVLGRGPPGGVWQVSRGEGRGEGEAEEV